MSVSELVQSSTNQVLLIFPKASLDGVADQQLAQGGVEL
jgi:hypothetical protein